MRLSGGDGKGRRLTPPPSGTRPTTGRVREVLFQLLPHDMKGLKVLDLFAGSGLLGLEAMARGAKSCLFVEKNHSAVKIIRKNISLCNMTSRTSIIHNDVFRSWKQLETVMPFDLIFADPPYGQIDLQDLLGSIMDFHLLSNVGVFVLETSSRIEPGLQNQQSCVLKEKKIGDTRLLLIGRN